MKFKLVPITRIVKKHYTGKVYDLTVSNTHTYNINGIVVHNSKCSTSVETGVYMPMITALQECDEVRKKQWSIDRSIYGHHLFDFSFDEGKTKFPLIIADGGIKNPSDMCKALAAGADLVLAGSIFAGTKESPGFVIKDNSGNLIKLYRGAASFGVQFDYSEKVPDYVEGKEGFVPYIGEVAKVIKRFKGGLTSSMSYMNAKTLTEFKNNSVIYSI